MNHDVCLVSNLLCKLLIRLTYLRMELSIGERYIYIYIYILGVEMEDFCVRLMK